MPIRPPPRWRVEERAEWDAWVSSEVSVAACVLFVHERTREVLVYVGIGVLSSDHPRTD